MRKLLVCAALALACAPACKKKAADKPATSESQTEQAPKHVPPAVRKVVTPITADEVKTLVATPEGARVIKEPTKAQYGERVELSYCFDSGELASLGESVKGTLTNNGWGSIVMRENPSVKGRMNMVAQHPPFMLTGALQPGTTPECPGDKGATLLTVNIHKQIPRPVGGLPVGPRPGLMRPITGPRPLPEGLQPVNPTATPQPTQPPN